MDASWDPWSSSGHASPELALVEALDWFGPAFARAVAAHTPAGAATTYPRLRVLRILARRGVQQRPAQLAAELTMTPATLTGLIDGLVGSGLIRRTPDPADGRATLLELTADGAAAAADQSAVQAAATLLDDLDRDEVLQLLATVKLLGNRLRQT